MKAVTVDQVLSWEPCKEYTRQRVENLFAGRETINVYDVLEMDISTADKLWAVLREDFITAEILHEFACRVAEKTLLNERKAGREPDERSWKAIEVKRKWLKGEATDSELKAARAAAGAARVVGAVAWAARSAWVAGAAGAAWAAAAAAGAAAARIEQIKTIKELLGEVQGE